MSKEAPKKRPDYIVKILDVRESTKMRTKASRSNVVAAGWKNDSGPCPGSISILLKPGVVLDWRDEVVITAFPVDDTGEDAE